MESENAETATTTTLSWRDIVHLAATYGAYFTFSAVCTVPASFFTVVAMEKKVSEINIGLIFGAYAFISVIGSPLMGKVIPAVGQRFCSLSSTFLSAGATLLFAFVADIASVDAFVILCICLRLVAGTGHLIFKGVAYNMWMTQYPDYLATLVGISSVAYGIGVTSGPVIGGILYDIGGFGTPFYAVSALLIVFFILMYFLAKDITDENEERETGWSFLNIYFSPRIYLPFLALMCLCMNNSFLDVTVAAQMKEEFQLSATLSGVMFAGFQIAYSVASVSIGRISDKFKLVDGLVITGLVLEVIAFMLLGPAPFFGIRGSVFLTETSLIINAIGQGCTFNPMFKYMYKVALDSGLNNDSLTKTKCVAFFLTAQATGNITGPIIAGVFLEKFGYAWACALIGFMNFFVLISNLTYLTLRSIH